MKKLESIKQSKFESLRSQELKDLCGIVGGGGPYYLIQATTSAAGREDTATWTFAGDGTSTHTLDSLESN